MTYFSSISGLSSLPFFGIETLTRYGTASHEDHFSYSQPSVAAIHPGGGISSLWHPAHQNRDRFHQAVVPQDSLTRKEPFHEVDRNHQLGFILADYEGLARKIIRRKVADKSFQEDVFQDFAELVTRKIHLFDGRSRLSTWFFVVLRNCILDHHRRQGRYDDRFVLDETGLENGVEARTPEDFLVLKRKMEKLMEALETLKPIFKEAFMLCVVGGRSLDEVSKRLQITVGALKSRVRIAKARIREILREG